MLLCVQLFVINGPDQSMCILLPEGDGGGGV